MIRKNIFYPLITVFMLLNFSGCTILGFVAGSKFDANRKIIKSPAFKKVEKIKVNTPLKILLWNDQIIAGTFQGVVRVDPAEYVQRYDTFRAEEKYNKLFPAINDTITMSKKPVLRTVVDKSRYLFTGFDFNALCIRAPADSTVKKVKLDSLVVLIDQHGRKMNARTIKKYLDGGVVPLRSELLLQSAAERQRIPLEKVTWIERPKKFTGRILFGLVGLGIDYLIFRGESFELISMGSPMGSSW